MINFALFGAGRIGILHAKNIFDNQKTNLSYIYDINSESSNKVKTSNKKMIKNKNYDIFCYINKNKQIALTKKKQVSFLITIISF